MDMGPAFAKSVRADGHAPQAVICFDPFHVVKVRREAPCIRRRVRDPPLWAVAAAR